MADDLKPLDFSLFSDRQLVDLLSQAYSEILKRRTRTKDLADRRRVAEGLGPRYRNPANSADTWSGKGPTPAWVREALAAGMTLESLEIREGDA